MARPSTAYIVPRSGRTYSKVEETPKEWLRSNPEQMHGTDGGVDFISPPGVSDQAWWEFLHKHGIVTWCWPPRARSWGTSERMPGWAGALVRWVWMLYAGEAAGPSPYAAVKVAKRAIRCASKDPDLLAALDTAWRVGRWPAVVSFVCAHPLDSRRPT